MGADEVQLDDKAKRMRDLLSSFYSPGPMSPNSRNISNYASFEDINSTSFDPDQYMNLLAQKTNLEGLLQRHVDLAAEIKNLDTDLQMLVYENYNKFISATDAIKRMKSNISGMEANTEHLLEKFIYDLPDRLRKCIKSEAYADADRFYNGAMPIFKVYGDTSFQDCRRASEEAKSTVVKNLQAKLFSDSQSMQARAEAAVLLKQLNFPVEDLKVKLLVKLEKSLAGIELKPEETNNASLDPSPFSSVHEATIHEFVEAIRAFQVIFPDSEKQLAILAQNLITKHFLTAEEYVKKRICAADLLGVLRVIWNDVLQMDEVLQEADLSNYSLEAAKVAIKLYVSRTISHLLQDVSDSLLKVLKKDGAEYSLEDALDASSKVVLEGSRNILLDFCRVLDDDSGLLVRLRELIVDLVKEGFLDFFRQLEDHFHLFSESNNSSAIQDHSLTQGAQGDKAFAGLVLVLAQLSAFIEHTAIAKITEELAVSFSGYGVRGHEYEPAFVPGEICQKFRSAGEKFLHLYINMRTLRISLLLKKRFTTPNWVKHKEPREVHMFVDLFLQELELIVSEVKQLLPQGTRKHRGPGSNGSSSSSRSNALREDKFSRSYTQRAKSQLLETHLAKLFKQKVEIFSKVEYTQGSVLTTIVKLCLKSLQEFVRLQTFNRSGFQQIQLDIQFLRTPSKEVVEDEAPIDFLLDEVIVAAAERCLDPIPLEPPILDKLIQSKMAKTLES